MHDDILVFHQPYSLCVCFILTFLRPNAFSSKLNTSGACIFNAIENAVKHFVLRFNWLNRLWPTSFRVFALYYVQSMTLHNFQCGKSFRNSLVTIKIQLFKLKSFRFFFALVLAILTCLIILCCLGCVGVSVCVVDLAVFKRNFLVCHLIQIWLIGDAHSQHLEFAEHTAHERRIWY